MGWLLWLLGIAVCCLLHQVFENRKLQAENAMLREELRESLKAADNLQHLKDQALATAGYLVATQGGRVEVPAWVRRTHWELRWRRQEGTGATLFETEELVQ